MNSRTETKTMNVLDMLYTTLGLAVIVGCIVLIAFLTGMY